jgi:ATP-dependent RNA helicase DeaD
VTFLPTSPQLDRALVERNYSEPTPVQTAVLADSASGRDLLVSAQTGSGKTVAYGLAIGKNLLGDAGRFQGGGKPRALVVAPTRELALQVQRELTWLYQYTGARVVSCVGGMDPRREQRELADGAHIVVGTPGRLCDHLRRGRLDVSELKAVVLDEADEMLDLGFREDLEAILKTMPEERRTLLFSATLPRGIVALAKQYQKNAVRIEVAGDEGGHADIEYRAIRVASHDIEHAVVNVLRYFESPSAIVFCNTRNAVNHLQAALLERGFSVVALSGELSQNERTHALQSLRDGRSRICVATDVAARGIDLPNLGLVIHADLPNDAEVLQHRSGRTGRAGRKGTSVMLVPPPRRRKAEIMLRQAGIDAVWGTAPQAEEIRKLDQQRMMQDSLFTEEPTEDDLVLARALLAERTPEAIASALARLYRARLPAPEDILDPGQDNFRDRFADRGRDSRSSSGDTFAPRERSERKARVRESLPGGSAWFRVSAGKQKKAEARWLLPMICRRGGVNKDEIGAIRIYEDHSEFEIAKDAVDKFTTKIQRPDKEQHVITALPNGPQGEGAPVKASPPPFVPKPYVPKAEPKTEPKTEPKVEQKFEPKAEPKVEPRAVETKFEPRANDRPVFVDKPRYEKKPYLGKKPHFDSKPEFDKKKPDYAKKREFGTKPGFEKKPYLGKKTHYDHKPPTDSAPRREDKPHFSKPAFGKHEGKPHFSKPAFAKHKGPKKNKKPKHRPNPMITDTAG